MKTQEEIEQLAFLEYPRLINDPYNPMEDDNAYERKIWIDGYTQCQEDMADRKYTEEDLKLAFETGRNFQLTGEDNFNELLNSLNKQD
jgi:hypothetical protein